MYLWHKFCNFGNCKSDNISKYVESDCKNRKNLYLHLIIFIKNMTARNLISPQLKKGDIFSKTSVDASICMSTNNQYVDANLHILEVFRRLMSSDTKVLAVVENGEIIGYIDSTSMLEGLNRLIIPRDDCSTIEIECRLIDFSASRIARAVEDADAHLLDMLSRKTDNDKIRILIRVSHIDPTAVVRSLERYDFTTIFTCSSEFNALSLSYERMAELALYLNI